MIFEAIINVIVGLVRLLFAALPHVGVPGWVDDGATSIGSIMGNFSGMGVWVPLGLAWQIFGVVILCYVAGFGIKVIRIVASFFTAGGGSAA